MLLKATLAAATATLCSPAIGEDLQPYAVTVLEEVRHEIIVEANGERAARTLALLEARRTSAPGAPAWRPSPSGVVAHARQGGGFAVIGVASPPLAPTSRSDAPRPEIAERVATP